MKKIPTIFERDWEGDRSRVLNRIVPGCEWVFTGEGIATRKYDGSACMVEDGVLWKRHEVRKGKQTPEDFRLVEDDLETGKTVGWIPVSDGPEDKWHRDAFARDMTLADGTYELVGPKVQGNPEGFEQHTLIRHSDAETFIVLRRTFERIRDLISELDVEGFVFQHPDGRMAKIKGRDFGIKRSSKE